MSTATQRIRHFVSFVVMATVWAAAPHATHAAVDLTGGEWREEFQSVQEWSAHTSWLPNPSDAANVTTDEDVACFSVDEPCKGMKWSHAITPVWLPEAPYLVVKYRAERCDAKSANDNFVYLADGSDKECHAFRLSDVVVDGKWHTIAVDAPGVAADETVDLIAVQVQASAEGNARLWVDYIKFVPSLPKDSVEIRREALPLAEQPDWVADLKKSVWQPHPDWLGNPTDRGEALITDEGIRLRVNEPSRGMKWSWDMSSPVTPVGYRYVVMRYRARQVRPFSDYALAVIGKARGDGMDYACAIPPNTILADGRWHSVAVELREVLSKLKSIGAFALQVQSGDQSPAELVVSSITFSNQCPEPTLSEFIDVRAGAGFDDFKPVNIAPSCNDCLERFLQHLHLKD